MLITTPADVPRLRDGLLDVSEVVSAAGAAMPLYDLHSDALPADVGLVVWGRAAVSATEHPGNDLRAGQQIDIRAALTPHAWPATAPPPTGGPSGGHPTAAP
jgi:hypothetical protein